MTIIPAKRSSKTEPISFRVDSKTAETLTTLGIPLKMSRHQYAQAALKCFLTERPVSEKLHEMSETLRQQEDDISLIRHEIATAVVALQEIVDTSIAEKIAVAITLISDMDYEEVLLHLSSLTQDPTHTEDFSEPYG